MKKTLRVTHYLHIGKKRTPDACPGGSRRVRTNPNTWKPPQSASPLEHGAGGQAGGWAATGSSSAWGAPQIRSATERQKGILRNMHKKTHRSTCRVTTDFPQTARTRTREGRQGRHSGARLTVHGHLVDLGGVVLLDVPQDADVVVLHEVDGHPLAAVAARPPDSSRAEQTVSEDAAGKAPVSPPAGRAPRPPEARPHLWMYSSRLLGRS